MTRAYSDAQLEALQLKEAGESVPSWARALLDDLSMLDDEERVAAIEAVRKLLNVSPKKVSYKKGHAA